MRNRSDQTVTVLIQYFDTATPPEGEPAVSQVEALAARQVRTINLRDVVNVPINGYLIASVVDAQTLTPLPDMKVLTGDYFRVEPVDNFATGDLLIGVSGTPRSGLCNRWELRYFQGGGFSGGTDFTFFVEENSGSGPIATGDIYDETGQFVTQITIGFDGYAFEFNSEQLVAPPLNIDVPFGVIEWQFRNGARGHVSSVLKALGKFAVGFSASCAD